MTYGDLLTLIPVLVNRPAAGLTERVDLVRRAVKWAYAYLLSNNDYEVFSDFADVDVTVVNGLSWQSFNDIDASPHSFSRIDGVSLWNEENDRFDQVELITKKHKAYRDLLRRPLRRTEGENSNPTSYPIVFIRSTKLFVNWLNEIEYPTTVRIRVEGTIALPNFLDTATLNAAQLDARDWVLDNCENYLIAKSIEFLQIYMKEDDRIAGIGQLADKEYVSTIRLDSMTKDVGFTLD